MLNESVLSETQKKFIPLLREFQGGFGMVGGTALALQLGHRKSIDYDLFSALPIDAGAIRRKIAATGEHIMTLVDTTDEYTVSVGGVKLTFLRYPFPLSYPVEWSGVARLADILTIAAMKAYALGRRAKWKDYADLYFVMKEHHPFVDVVRKAEEIFGGEFSEKNFRAQLSYFDDIDCSEAVEFLPGHEIDDETIRKSLTDWSLT